MSYTLIELLNLEKEIINFFEDDGKIGEWKIKCPPHFVLCTSHKTNHLVFSCEFGPIFDGDYQPNFSCFINGIEVNNEPPPSSKRKKTEPTSADIFPVDYNNGIFSQKFSIPHTPNRRKVSYVSFSLRLKPEQAPWLSKGIPVVIASNVDQRISSEIDLLFADDLQAISVQDAIYVAYKYRIEPWGYPSKALEQNRVVLSEDSIFTLLSGVIEKRYGAVVTSKEKIISKEIFSCFWSAFCLIEKQIDKGVNTKEITDYINKGNISFLNSLQCKQILQNETIGTFMLRYSVSYFVQSALKWDPQVDTDMGPIVVCYRDANGVKEKNLTGVQLASFPLSNIILKNNEYKFFMNPKSGCLVQKEFQFKLKQEANLEFKNIEYEVEGKTIPKPVITPVVPVSIVVPTPVQSNTLDLFFYNPINNNKMVVKLKNRTFVELLNLITEKLKNVGCIQSSDEIDWIKNSDEVQIGSDQDILDLQHKSFIEVKLK